MFVTPPSSSYGRLEKDPGTALVLSFFLPGLGQIYSGEKRKGLLFIGVSIINLILFFELIFQSALLKSLVSFGKAFHLVPNPSLYGALVQLRLNSPPVILVEIFFLIFIGYAAKDAYRSVLWSRRPIYAEHALTMTEATSGSYLAHCTLLANFFLFALFFLIPQHPRAQITEIVFITNQPTNLQRTQTKTKSERDSRKAGPHVEKKPISPAPSSPSRTQTAPPSAPSAVAPRQAQQNDTPKPPAPQKPSLAPQPPRPVITPTPQKPSLSPQPPRPTTAQAPPSPQMRKPSQSESQNPRPLVALLPRPLAGGSQSLLPSPLPYKTSVPNLPGPLPTSPGPSSSSPGAGPRPHTGAPTSAASVSSPGPTVIRTNSGDGPPSITPISTDGERGHKPGGRFGDNPGPTKVGHLPNGSPLAVTPTFGSPRPGAPSGRLGQGTPGQPNSEQNDNPKGSPAPSGKKVDFGAYMAELQRRIKRAWIPPHREESRQVVVIFKIHHNGEMSHLRLEKSSGAPLADQAATDAVERAAPFPPLPDGSPEDVDIMFTFDYKVFSGSGVFRRF